MLTRGVLPLIAEGWPPLEEDVPSWLDVEPMLEEEPLSEEEEPYMLDVELMPEDLLLTEGVYVPIEDVWPPSEEDVLISLGVEHMLEEELLSEEDVLTSLGVEHMPEGWPLGEELMLDVLLPIEEELQLIAEEWPPTEDACMPREELISEG